MSDHRARYKNAGLDAKELRRRREEGSVTLRKQKRDDVLSKRRTLVALPKDDTDSDISFSPGKRDIQEKCQITKEMIEGLMQDVDLALIIETSQKIRKMLSKEPQPPIDEVIQSGIIPRLAELLDRDDSSTLQFEVAWILTNICSGTTDQTRIVVNHGAVPKLIKLLSSPDTKVNEQAVWALGNIVGDCPEFRDFVLGHNFLPALLTFIRSDLDVLFLRNVTWVLVNICRNKDPPTTLDVVGQLVQALYQLIHSTDLLTLIDSTWAIAYITELGPQYSQIIIDSGLLVKLTPLVIHTEDKIQTASIRALGSIVTGDEEQTQAVLDSGVLPYMLKILSNASTSDRVSKEALWFISNITAGSVSQIQSIIDNGLIPVIIKFLGFGNYQEQKEAVWSIYNMCLSGNPSQLQFLVENGVIQPLCNLLNLKDTSFVRNILEALSLILGACADNHPDILETIEACGGLDAIEQLQANPNEDIYKFAYTIIENYFNYSVN